MKNMYTIIQITDIENAHTLFFESRHTLYGKIFQNSFKIDNY